MQWGCTGSLDMLEYQVMRAVTGLLTGHNALRKHIHLTGLSDSPLCRRCGAEEET